MEKSCVKNAIIMKKLIIKFKYYKLLICLRKMALKDWKKVKDEYHQTKWIHKFEDENEIAIEPSGRGDWVFWSLSPTDSFTRLSKRKYKTFKTKQEALKFARAYMRKY